MTTNNLLDARVEVLRAMQDGGYTFAQAAEMLGRYDDSSQKIAETLATDRINELSTQVNEIHQFIKLLSGALNNPMVRAMIPAHMRGMMGN